MTGYSSHSDVSIIYFLVTMTLVASETVVGLVFCVLYHRVGKDITLDNLTILNG